MLRITGSICFTAGLCVVMLPIAARADDPEYTSRLLEIRPVHTTVKTSLLRSHAPVDPYLFPDRDGMAGFGRLRLDVPFTLGEATAGELAYEHRVTLSASKTIQGLGGSAQFSGGADAPYRIAQLDWQVASDGDHYFYRHELDRAYVSRDTSWGRISVGRQAIGLGRGVLFNAVDLFSPFSPVEVDREWRRGVDAIRVEYRTSAVSSLELISVFGERWDDSAIIGRVRGYTGDIDAELLFGKRGRDAMLGGVLSSRVGGGEVHLELAAFRTPEKQASAGVFGDRRLVANAVLGGSYTFNVGKGLTVLGEYHYSGFGVSSMDTAFRRLASESFQQRYYRGDKRILGRQALALQVSYPFHETLAGALLVLQSPVDGSGLLSPSVIWNASDTVAIRATTFLPWGDEPLRGRPRSEYGLSPTSFFLQFAFYF